MKQNKLKIFLSKKPATLKLNLININYIKILYFNTNKLIQFNILTINRH